MPDNSVFTFKIGGEAGFGIMSAGLVFSKIAVRSGYYIFDYIEYPSIIRGGHNVMQVTVSSKPVCSQYSKTNFLVALNQETVDLHKHELVKGSGVLYDPENPYHYVHPKTIPKAAKKFPVPINKIAIEIGKSVIMRNTVALGASIGLLGGNIRYLKAIISESFAHKSDEVVKRNHLCAQAGYDYVLEHFAKDRRHILKPKKEVKKQIVITGNEAVSLGAIAGGMTFAAIYPMTPTSAILHNLAPLQQKYAFVYKQPEDEISAINMAIGASFAGARSMVATSGGGFSLMVEAYGLAGMTENPLVIIEGMRGSPATGLPTWTEQGDLRFVLHAHQGDFPRIVLAAGDVEEAFHLTLKAFNLADKYQTPVLLLVDEHLCESHMSISPFDYKYYKLNRGKFTTKKIKNYKRYKLASSGISERTIPGVGNFFVSNSDEHSEFGFSEESAKNRNEQMNKRMQKLITCEKEDMEDPKLYGPKDAKVTIVSWGSNKGAILDAINNFDNVNYLHLTWINPFPIKMVREVLERAKYLVNIECNYSAQMGGLIAEKTGIRILDNMLKFDGRPFYPEEITTKLNRVLRGV